ncbi:MAG TPA: hypothetical protein VN958_12790 [Chitinophagaceae bacterium]|nr:hypothetical protein [Chitinophagaceae bacterium]
MLNLYELRIGNFFEIEFLSTGKKKTKKVSEIRQKQVLLEGTWYPLDKLISIPITEEMLLQSGFTKLLWITEANVFKCDYFKCRLDENVLQVFGNDFNNLKPVRYLHELQNLYFDLTEKELEIHFAEVDQPRKVKFFRKEKNFVLLSSNT